MNRIVYLDNSSTTPIDKEVLQEMKPYLKEKFGNPSSEHSLGYSSKIALESARQKVSSALNVQPYQIVFTSGGTESNVTVLRNLLNVKSKKKHIVLSAIEHPSIINECQYLEKYHGFKLSYCGVDNKGIININELKRLVTNETALITVMMVNNEVGSIQPIKEIADFCSENNIHMHCDGVQALGKVEIDLEKLKVDSYSISSHKIGGPKGVGALFIRRPDLLSPLINGGGQERSLRSGTENIPGIVGFGAAVELAANRLAKYSLTMKQNKNHFIDYFIKNIPNVVINGDITQTVGSILNISFIGIRGQALANLLNEHYIYVSIGSACSNLHPVKSHVLQAMGASEEIIMSAIRISLGSINTYDDVLYAGEIIRDSVQKLREISLVCN